MEHHHTTTVLQPFFRDHPGEPVPKENFWILWCKGRLAEADTPTIRMGTTPSGLTSAHLHHPPIFFTGRNSWRKKLKGHLSNLRSPVKWLCIYASSSSFLACTTRSA